MVVDELITLIRFDMPGNSSAVLKKSEHAVSSLTKRVRDLGIVSMATGALTAAIGINAANEANSLQRAAEVTGLTTERLQQLESVYKSVGGSAKNAAQDAEAFFRASGGEVMDDNALDFLRSYTAGMDDAGASMKLQAAGFSDDIRRVLGLGDEEFQKRMQYASDFHSLTQQEIDDLHAARDAWVSFGSTADTVSERIQAAISPSLASGLSELTSFINENADDIAEGVRKVADRVVDFAERGASAAGEVYDVIKPIWDVFDYAVEKYVGWDNAIAGTVAVLGGFAGLTAIATVAGTITGLAGALTGLAAAGSGVALALGAGGAVVLAISELDRVISEFENTGGLNRVFNDINNFISGKKTPDSELNSASGEMSIAEKYLTATDTSGMVDPALQQLLVDQGWSNEMYRDRAMKEMKHGLASPRYMTGGTAQNNPNVTVQNEINITGVQGAADAADRLGEAAAQGTRSAINESMNLRYPTGTTGGNM